MGAATVDIVIEQGSTFSHQFIWQNADRNAINLTGYTARMMIREKVTSTTVLVTLTTENGGITLGGVSGTVDLLISATDTAALTILKMVYDLELVTGATVTRLTEGRCSLSREVTR